MRLYFILLVIVKIRMASVLSDGDPSCGTRGSNPDVHLTCSGAAVLPEICGFDASVACI